MKKWFLNLILLIFFAAPVMSQQGNKQIESVKIAYLTSKLSLTPEEAQRFWPVYQNYQRDLQQVFQQRQRDRQEAKKSGGQVDELKYEATILDVRKRYRKQFAEVLPQQKVALVFQAEREFREQLIQHLRERRGN